MKKSFRYRKNRATSLSRRGAVRFGYLAGVTILLVGLFLAKGTLRAEDDLQIEDLAEVSDPVSASGETISDLEKVIADEPAPAKAASKAATQTTEAATDDLTEETLKGLEDETPQAKSNSDDESIENLEKELAKEETPAPPPVREAATEVVPEPVAEPAPEPAPEPVRAQPATIAKNAITNLEFRMAGDKSRIVVTTLRRPVFREEKNQALKQSVFVFENMDTPQRLQRAYDTSEFKSAVSLFTLFQIPGRTVPTSKLIVQLREDKAPLAQVTETGLFIDYAPPDKIPQDPKLVIGDGEGPIEENIYSTGKIFSGRKMDRLEVKNSDVQDVLRLIAKTSGYNIVVGDDVQGKVGTLSLEAIPWDQAFTLVLQSKKLGYVRTGNVIRVAQLATLKSEKEEAIQNEKAQIQVEPLRTVLIPVSYAKADELTAKAKSMLTERGTVDFDKRTNTLIIKDVDRNLTKAQKLIAALDTQPPLVSIQARVVEMLTQFGRGIGFSSTSMAQSFAGLDVRQNITLIPEAGISNGQSVTRLTAPMFAALDTQFAIGQSESKVKIHASPTVSVLANQTGNIRQSISFFIPTTEVVAGVAIATLKQISTNLSLDVTPIVAGDGSISMKINVNNEIPRGSGSARTIDTRSITTDVMLENGDTAVIGGIFSSTVNTENLGVPFLMDLPVLGFFFQRNTFDDSRNEVFMFVTAKILNAEQAFKRTY